MKTYAFRNCEVRIFPETQYLETRFHDGSVAGATRECVLNNLTYAQHLGYPDCWTAVVSHEIAHTYISEQLGHPYSPTLFAVAHNYIDDTAAYEERLWEEALVLAVERYMRTGYLLPILGHPAVFKNFYGWSLAIAGIVEEVLR